MSPIPLVCLALLVAAPVEPSARWSGQIAEGELRTLAPAEGFLTAEAEFAALWQAWRPDEKRPAVDFTADFVLVGTADGPNTVLMRPMLTPEGDLKYAVASTRRGGPGFGYLLLQVPRAGVKTVNGEPLDFPGVRGAVVIPAEIGAFENLRLEITLWEYDPRLADAPAKRVDKFEKPSVSHQAGERTTAPFTLGGKAPINPERGYYLTAWLKEGKADRFFGEPADKSFLCKVLTLGHPSRATLVFRPVR